MKILLVGAAGQLGTHLQASLATLGQLVCATRNGVATAHPSIALDIADAHAIARAIAKVTPDIVVNAAAYTAVDRAESERDAAFAINATAPREMARACRQIGARFVHYSTDYVFGGTGNVPYREDDAVDPQGVYGASKAAGEAAIREEGGDYLILRTAWVYALHGQNFLRTMLRLAAERDELRVVSDQVGCPTPTWFIAEMTRTVLAMQAEDRLLHVTTRGTASWADFAAAIVQEASARGLLARTPRVERISTKQFPTPARRPAYSVLDTRRLEALAGRPVPHWQRALADTFERG